LSTQLNTVDGAYFKALGIPILRGRNFDARDTRQSQPFVIGDQIFTRQFFPHGGAVGHQLKIGNTRFTIIGVVAPVQYLHLKGANKPLRHQNTSTIMSLVVHTKIPPTSLI
jgi:hypothetical protein